jgi:hypothetical protein
MVWCEICRTLEYLTLAYELFISVNGSYWKRKYVKDDDSDAIMNNRHNSFRNHVLRLVDDAQSDDTDTALSSLE